VLRLGTCVLHVSGCWTDRPPGSRFGSAGHHVFAISVTNAAGRGNDLLMVVSDEELLVASVGDEEAFAAFYRRHARPLAGFFMRRTGDAELAADLTAETFAAALAARRRFDPAKGAAIGWLYGIARHKLARTLQHGRVEDRARRALGMAPLVLDDEAIELVVTAEGDVVLLLQRLPADQRAAIEARVVDGQEYEQIAAAAQTSEAVIRKRVSRGLASLRRKLEGPTA
jgi:RNA polymerase sigma factor (sigma-70 family)